MWAGRGEAIFTCPERSSDRCPFVEQWREKKLNLVEQVLLYNSNSGVRLQRTTLWGIELSYKWVTSGKPVPIDLALSQPLAYPPGLTALPTGYYIMSMKQAVAILRTALIGLLAKGQIQVHHSQIHEFKTWGVLEPAQDVYSVVATQEFESSV